MRRLSSLLDPFLMLLLAVVALATILPPRGAAAGWTAVAADAGIVLLFFLHGAKLSREAVWAGLLHWRLHGAVLATSFIVFPLLGLGLVRLPDALVPPEVAPGLLYLTLLPSTVQSSIAFTAMAGGNVPAAVCSASFSNLLGTVLTPLLVASLMGFSTAGSGGALNLDAMEKIALQLLLPFILGHVSRPLTGAFVARHARWVSRVDRGSILLIVYAAFGAAVVEGLWSAVSGRSVLSIVIACLSLLAMVMLFTWMLGRLMRFNRADSIVLFFCGSKKSLATGAPMAALLFPPPTVGLIILPTMIFHQIQLMACAVIARRMARRTGEGAAE